MTDPAVGGVSAGDPAVVAEHIAETAARVVPGDALTVTRRRSLSDRMSGRPGAIAELKLASAAETLRLAQEHGAWVAETARVSGGVIISRRRMPLGEWLDAFAGRVAAIAADAAQDQGAAARALRALGVSTAASGVRVGDATLDSELSALPLRLRGQVPEAAVGAVQRIADAIREALPRVAQGTDADFTLRRAATTYLPDTLNGFLALPEDWRAQHRFANGSSAADELIGQLGVIETAVESIRSAALNDDAEALRVNGRFLEDRFGASSLDLG
ncbi:hypothetical protein ACFOYW_11095 [Gryllotalpicola reticulitermitis]|uniref:DUF222 domain-containing protein n=1 Tax=Gryllotalpicola reticulitermitis TaxID=1184153 RepID=A0ABV8Q6D7_9MICO